MQQVNENQDENSEIGRRLRRRFERTPQSDFTIEDGESEQRESYKSEIASQWNVSDFSACSQTCAGGIQTRDVFCEQVIMV